MWSIVLALGAMTALPWATAQQMAGPPSTQASTPASVHAGVLKPTEMTGLMPEQVFYRGKTASVQIRNSGGVRFADGMLMLAGLVDTSGYSSTVQQRYQAYLITEVTLTIGDQRLVPGAYGIGFIEGDRFVVMDVGDHELLHAESHRDAEIRRPTPLQVEEAEKAGTYRLYGGRSYVELRRAE